MPAPQPIEIAIGHALPGADGATGPAGADGAPGVDGVDLLAYRHKTVDPLELTRAVAAAIAIFRFKVGMMPVLAACSLAGIALYFLGVR